MRHMENSKRVIFARITAAKQGIAFLLSHWKTVLSLSAFNGWVFSMSWSGVFAPPDSLAGSSYASAGIWFTSLAVCTVVLGVFLLRPVRREAFAARAGSLFMILSVVLSVLSRISTDEGAALFVASGIASGIGTGIATNVCARIVVRYDASVILQFIAASLAFSSLLTMLVALVASPAAYIMMVVLPLVMSRFLADVLDASLGGRTVLSDEELHVQDGIENRARPSVMLFMGLAVVLGVSAGLLKGLVGGEPGVKPNALVVGISVACSAAMLFASRIPERDGSFSLFYRAIALIAAAFIALTVASQRSYFAAFMPLAIHTIGFAYFYGLLWVFCALYSRDARNPLRVFVGGFFANQLGQIVGAVVMDACSIFLDVQPMAATVANVMIYVLLFSVIVLLAKLSSGKDNEQKATIATLRGIDELCSEAALEKGLTPRESEILPYLAKGYDRGFIASELTISVETVRSHTRHIYGKFDVHTRVELLNAIALRGRDD